MTEVIITRNFHPNEEVAVDRALELSEVLMLRGVSVIPIDLEQLRLTSGDTRHWAQTYVENPDLKFDLFNRIVDEHSGLLILDVHDMPHKQNSVLFGQVSFDKPMLQSTRCFQSHARVFRVEQPAVYKPQTNPEVVRFIQQRPDDLYLVEKSLVHESREEGLLDQSLIVDLVDNILHWL